MSQSLTIPPEARCLGCGYLLQGLPAPTCPECGRKFDPADPTTFDTRPPNWRRRRWIKRGVWATAAGLVVIAVGPRALLKGDLSFTCSHCGVKITVYRFEPKPPSWIPWRYPGLTWTSRAEASNATGTPSCDHRFSSIRVQFDLYMGGRATSSCSACNEATTFNGQLATLANAANVLYNLMSPYNFGIGP